MNLADALLGARRAFLAVPEGALCYIPCVVSRLIMASSLPT
jgi:hypothetical protein